MMKLTNILALVACLGLTSSVFAAARSDVQSGSAVESHNQNLIHQLIQAQNQAKQVQQNPEPFSAWDPDQSDADYSDYVGQESIEQMDQAAAEAALADDSGGRAGDPANIRLPRLPVVTNTPINMVPVFRAEILGRGCRQGKVLTVVMKGRSLKGTATLRFHQTGFNCPLALRRPGPAEEYDVVAKNFGDQRTFSGHGIRNNADFIRINDDRENTTGRKKLISVTIFKQNSPGNEQYYSDSAPELPEYAYENKTNYKYMVGLSKREVTTDFIRDNIRGPINDPDCPFCFEASAGENAADAISNSVDDFTNRLIRLPMVKVQLSINLPCGAELGPVTYQTIQKNVVVSIDPDGKPVTKYQTMVFVNGYYYRQAEQPLCTRILVLPTFIEFEVPTWYNQDDPEVYFVNEKTKEAQFTFPIRPLPGPAVQPFREEASPEGGDGV